MARTGFYLAGFNGSPKDFFPNVLPEIGGPNGSFLDTFPNAFNFVWRYRTLRLAYDFMAPLAPGGFEHVAGSYLTSPLGGPSELTLVTNEKEIGPFANTSPVGLRQFGTDLSGFIGIHVDDYDATLGAHPFQFYSEINIPWSVDTLYTNPNPSGGIGSLAQVDVTVLGRPQPMYSASVAFGTFSGTVDVTVEEWWSYDDGSGPIWDSVSGGQLITPIPRNFS